MKRSLSTSVSRLIYREAYTHSNTHKRSEWQTHTQTQTQTQTQRRRSHTWQNWSHTAGCRVQHLITPSTEHEVSSALQRVLHTQVPSIKVLGAGHSLSPVAVPDQGGWAMDLQHYTQPLHLDTEKSTLTVQAGASLQSITQLLYPHQRALSHLGSISLQTIGGVIQTGTHATGYHCGPLHTMIESMTVFNGKGEKLTLSQTEQPALFQAHLCGLGVMGIVSTVTIRIVNLFYLHETTYGVSCDGWSVLDDMIEKGLLVKHQHVKLLWYPYIDQMGIWQADPCQPPISQHTNIQHSSTMQGKKAPSSSSLVDVLAVNPMDPRVITQYNLLSYTQSFSEVHSRCDESWKVFNVDCGPAGQLYAIEAAFPLSVMKPVLSEFHTMIQQYQLPAHGPVEIRFVKADNAWMSPTYSDDAEDRFVYVSLGMIRPYGQVLRYEEYFQHFYRLVTKFRGRIHWGKMGYTHDRQYLEQVYPKYKDFIQLQQEQDPKGIFVNEYTRQILGRQ